MVQLRNAAVCALLVLFALGSQAGRNTALTWCQPLTGKMFIFEHTTSRFGAGMLLPGRAPGVVAAHFVLVLVSTVLQVFCANET